MCKCIMICIRLYNILWQWHGLRLLIRAVVWVHASLLRFNFHFRTSSHFAIPAPSSSLPFKHLPHQWWTWKASSLPIRHSSSAMLSLKHWQFTFRQLLFSISCHEDLYSSNSPLSIFVIVLKYPRVVQELSDKPFGCLLCKERRKEFKKFRENCVLWTSWSV